MFALFYLLTSHLPLVAFWTDVWKVMTMCVLSLVLNHSGVMDLVAFSLFGVTFPLSVTIHWSTDNNFEIFCVFGCPDSSDASRVQQCFYINETSVVTEQTHEWFGGPGQLHALESESLRSALILCHVIICEMRLEKNVDNVSVIKQWQSLLKLAFDKCTFLTLKRHNLM